MLLKILKHSKNSSHKFFQNRKKPIRNFSENRKIPPEKKKKIPPQEIFKIEKSQKKIPFSHTVYSLLNKFQKTENPQKLISKKNPPRTNVAARLLQPLGSTPMITTNGYDFSLKASSPSSRICHGFAKINFVCMLECMCEGEEREHCQRKKRDEKVMCVCKVN